MASEDLWYIHRQDGRDKEKGPYSTPEMEDFARQDVIGLSTLISSEKYTRGKVVEARRIGRFFNIFSGVAETTALTTVDRDQFSSPPMKLEERDEEVGGIGRFMADGQDPTMVIKLVQRVQGICTKEEQCLYMAIQQKPVVNLAPDAVVLTNRRVIIFRQKVLGRLDFIDVTWLNVADIHLREDILGSTIYVAGLNGHAEQISHLPKPQARKIYRLAQDMEEKMVDLRRTREMEERKAGATQITVNNDLGSLASPISPTPVADPVKSLQSLKDLLDAGLIEQSEYDAKKREILSRM